MYYPGDMIKTWERICQRLYGKSETVNTIDWPIASLQVLTSLKSGPDRPVTRTGSDSTVFDIAE